MAGTPDTLDLGIMMKAELASAMRTNALAHDRYLHVMDRVYLSQYTAEQNPLPATIGGLATASHVPY